MENRLLVGLIKRYYPRSTRFAANYSHDIALRFSTVVVSIAHFTFVLLVLVPLFTESFGGLGWALLPLAMYLTVVHAILSFCHAVAEFYPNKFWARSWNKFFTLPYRLWLPVERPITLRSRLRQNPYAPDLIFGTVEAIEAELAAKQAEADKAIAQRRQSLEAHQGKLKPICAKIGQRIGQRSADTLLDRSRLDEATAALEDIVGELFNLRGFEATMAQSLLPAKALANSLRALYRDALEVETIARAKGAVTSSVDQSHCAELALELQQAAIYASGQLEAIREAVGAKLAAEAEIDRLIGIQPVENSQTATRW